MRVLLILISLLLVGCASTAKNTKEKLDSYIGSSIDKFLIQVTPENITNLYSGGKKYDFKTLEATLPYPIACNFALITDKRGIIIQSTEPRCF